MTLSGTQHYTLEDRTLHTYTYLEVNTGKFVIWTRSKLTDDALKTKKFRMSNKNTYYIFLCYNVFLLF
jgi:hypothetical protein